MIKIFSKVGTTLDKLRVRRNRHRQVVQGLDSVFGRGPLRQPGLSARFSANGCSQKGV